jgi:phosphoribosylglycinamide formyltransferase-1
VSARIAVFASGGGSNLQALLDHDLPIQLDISDRPSIGALTKAIAHQIEWRVLDDPNDGDAIQALLKKHNIDLVVLAGYLRHVPDVVTRAYHGRILNIHPSLLPAFGGPGMYGRRVHAAVIAAGARESGATVHFVDPVYDRGPIVAQWRAPVLPTDTPDTLAARVLGIEHRLYPRAVAAVADGRVRLDTDGQVIGALNDLSQGEDPSAPH